MPRLLSALTIAVSAHVLLFFSFSSLLKTDHNIPEVKNKSVIISMSYKKPEKIIVQQPKKIIKSFPKIKKIKPIKIKNKKTKKPVVKIKKVPINYSLKDTKQKQIKEIPHEEIKPEKVIPQKDTFEDIILEQKHTDFQAVKVKEHKIESSPVIKKGPVRIKFSDPAYKNNPLPVYPKKSRKRGHQGLVELKVLISVQGKVSQIAIEKSSGFKGLDKKALKTIKNWIFQPRKENGKPVDTWVIVPIRFKLR